MKTKHARLINNLLCLLLLTGCGNATQIKDPVVQPKSVEVMAATVAEKSVLFQVIGNAEPAEMTKVGPKTGGLVLTIAVTEGQTVQKGDILATMDASGQDDALSAAAATLSAARARADSASKAFLFAQEQYENILSLQKSGAAAQSQVDEVKLQLDIARNDLTGARDMVKQAEADLAFRQKGVAEITLQSPKDGIVTLLPVKIGELVAAGTPLVVLKSAHSIIKFHIPDRLYDQIAVGAKVTISAAGEDQNKADKIAATVSKVAEIADAASRSMAVEAETDAFLLTGIPLLASLEIDVVSGFWIPIDAILSGETDYVYLVKDGKAIRREIVITGYNGFDALVTGVESGELIITTNAGNIKPFEPVNVFQAKEGQ